MKRIICIILALLFVSTSVLANPLYTKTFKETVTGGVTRTNIQKFYGSYALNIDIITADLKDEHISIDLLKNTGGCDKVDTVMNLAKTQADVVAATNADFFSYYKGTQNFSLGLEIKNGELLQSHIKPEMAAGIFKNGALAFSYLDFGGVVTAPNGATSALTHINKPTDYYGAVLMYTPDFNGGTSPFLPVGITALTVTDGVVSAKGVSQGGTIPIPENGYILVIDDNMTPFFEYNFNIGDAVSVNLSTAQLTDGAETAFGGGTLLLKDGAKTKITHDVAGNNPRTAIGTNADGTVVYLITVDGRQTASRGVTLSVLQDICLEAGMVNAMNFDGGGSTAMVAKTLSDSELHYINSPSETRKVINAVAITSDAESGETAGFIAAVESPFVLSGDSVKINLTPHDKNFNKPVGTPNLHEWKVSEGSGYVENDVYYAEGSGKTVLDLYYNGQKTDSVSVTVLDSVAGINAPEALSLTKGAVTSVSGVEVFDKEGNTAKVNDITLLNPKFDSSFLSVSASGVKALRDGGSELLLSYGKAQRGIKITCGNYVADSSDPFSDDPLYSTNSDGVVFNVLGFDGADTLFDRLVFKKGMDTFRSAHISAVLGKDVLTDLTPQRVSPLTAQAWLEYNHDYAKIVSLDLSDKGVLERGDRWNKLSSALNGAQQKNIFVLLDKKAGFVQNLDALAFVNMVESAAKRDKNVFVVYNGDENFCTVKNGVRYITVADSKDEDMISTAMEKAQYLSFNLTSYGATYCFRNLY